MGSQGLDDLFGKYYGCLRSLVIRCRATSIASAVYVHDLTRPGALQPQWKHVFKSLVNSMYGSEESICLARLLSSKSASSDIAVASPSFVGLSRV